MADKFGRDPDQLLSSRGQRPVRHFLRQGQHQLKSPNSTSRAVITLERPYAPGNRGAKYYPGNNGGSRDVLLALF
jgi:hypothetical protein